MSKRYVSKGEWFDEGTEARVVDGILFEAHGIWMGLFEGTRGGETDQEMCWLDEFTVVDGYEVRDLSWFDAGAEVHPVIGTGVIWRDGQDWVGWYEGVRGGRTERAVCRFGGWTVAGGFGQ